MSYYMGDFYRGDYYRGDPGRRSTALAVRLPMPGVPAWMTGAPLGGMGMAGALAKRPGFFSGLMRRAAGVVTSPAAKAILGAVLPPIGGMAIGAAGAAAAMMRGRRGAVVAGAEAAPRGFHISKRTGRTVRNRRLNPYNPRALRRAVRRAHAFARMARRVISFTSPRAPRGRIHFKTRRRKK